MTAVQINLRLDRRAVLLTATGTGFIIAGGLVAAIQSASPFTHGAWLAAYLVLVGGASQLALGLGHLALRAQAPPAHLRDAQLTMWNAGNAAVAGGVLAGSTILVAAGSVALVVALATFAAGVGRGRPGARRWTLAYHLLLAALAVSVGIGCALAGAAPGGSA
ncbi:MAG TPA: hypothetical protein VFT50_15360 [Baekduia sp.]|nr:hypothetical protein [Baekduia sp.]